MANQDRPTTGRSFQPQGPWFLRSRLRLYAVLILALAIPGAALSALVSFDVKSELRAHAERENQLVASMVAQSLNERLSGLKLYVRSYAERIRFSESVCARDPEFGHLVLSQMVAGSDLISRVFLADTTGVIWLDSPSDPSVLGQSFAHRDWFQGASRSDDVYVSEIYRRQALGQPYTIAVSRKIHDLSGHYCGVLVAQVTLDDLADWFLKLRLPRDRTIALVDQHGHWFDNTQIPTASIEFADTTTFAAFLGPTIPSAEAVDPVSGVPSIVSTASAGSANWTVISRQNVDNISLPVRALQQTIAIYFIAGLLGMIVIGGAMYQTLNHYHNERTKAQFQLLRAYEDVELTVRARTSELISANAESRRLAAIIESSTDSICSCAMDGTMTSWNEAAERLYGYSRSEIVGQSARILLPDDRVEEALDLLQRISNGERFAPIETMRRHKDGRLLYISQMYSPIRADNGSIVGVSIVSRDITQQKLIEEQAQRADRERAEALERLQMTFDRMPIGCILNDPEFRFTYWNPAAEGIFGYRFDEIKGELPFGIITPESSRAHVADVFRRLAEGGEDVDVIGENITKDGRRITCVWNNTSMRDREGKFIGVISMCQDVTVQKRDEERLRVYASALAQNNRELQDFAFVASHDLQEPLRKIAAFGDRLRDSAAGVLGDESLDYLGRMQNAAQRMQTLINDLLDFSRVATRAQPFVSTDLNVIAKEVMSDLETRIEQTLGRVEIGQLPTLEADPVQMRQLLQNLIANALKFHRRDVGPIVRVSAIRLPASAGSPMNQECVQILVEDNGIGFDVKFIDRIFTPFQRLHARHEFEGTGMGLAICRKISERHHGAITATSNPGQGSTFIVTLPLHQPDAGRALWTQTADPSASSWPTTTPTIVS